MEREGNHIDLLISLLIRFPQIGAIHYDPGQTSLRLVFLLNGLVTDANHFCQEAQRYLASYHKLSKIKPKIVLINSLQNAGITTIKVKRDLASLSLGELNLIIRLLVQSFADNIVQEGPETEEEEEFEQDAIIESLLTFMPRCGRERLTGFRENGRVLVFSLPTIGVSE